MTLELVYPLIQTLPEKDKVSLLERLKKELVNTKSIKSMSKVEENRIEIRERLKTKLFPPK